MSDVLEKMGNLVVFLLIVALGVVGAWGWVWNIVKLTSMGIDQLGMFVVRVAGILIPPLGAVVGFF